MFFSLSKFNVKKFTINSQNKQKNIIVKLLSGLFYAFPTILLHKETMTFAEKHKIRKTIPKNCYTTFFKSLLIFVSNLNRAKVRI